MNIILFDSHKTREQLLPLTFTRPVADIRIGIMTIREKWEHVFECTTYSLTETYLLGKFLAAEAGEPSLYINGAVLPSDALAGAIRSLGAMQVLMSGDTIVAFKSEKQQLNYANFEAIAKGFSAINYAGTVVKIEHNWDIFKLNGEAIEQDFIWLTQGKTSEALSLSNTVIGDPKRIFLSKGAKVEAAILNTTAGPIYLGEDAEIMEGTTVRGPLALCDHAALKMSAKVYGPTTLGPHCKAGGELNNVVFFGYSNKAHDGFLGNSVIGEWCNLGADTNNSNLKNNYGLVDVYDYGQGKAVDTGLTFCGLIMADHAKAGINTMFNTGTVVGVSANIFGGDFPPKFIPSFSWGGAQWLRTFTFDKSLEVAQKMMERRGLSLSDADINILKTVFEREEKNRKSK